MTCLSGLIGQPALLSAGVETLTGGLSSSHLVRSVPIDHLGNLNLVIGHGFSRDVSIWQFAKLSFAMVGHLSESH